MSKFLFVVQGEGRGHLTQAISLSEILTDAGHEVVAVLVGKGNNLALPTFFQERIQAPIHTFASPSLVYGQGKALRVWDTIKTHLLKAKDYFKSISYLAQQVDHYQPDIVINFYEMVCGLYFTLHKPAIPCVCIAHQYLLLHKDFESIPHKLLDRCLLNINTRLTALGSTQKLALSFDNMPNDPTRAIRVVPPLLRSEVKQLKPSQKPYILAYITHHKLGEDIAHWHENHREVEIHCFWNNPDFSDEWQIRENLTFHQVNAEKFLTMMQDCSGLVCTAGFESVCEAMYLGKPIMMVPVPNHIEQEINAWDAQRAGAGIANTSFDFSKFLDYLPRHQSVHEQFEDWQSQTNSLFLDYLETLTQPQAEIYTLSPNTATIPQFWWQGLFQKYL